MESNGFERKWRKLKVDEVDMKLRQSNDIEFKKQESNICMEIGHDDFKYIVRGVEDDSEGESEGLRVIIKEEMEDVDSYSIAVNKRKNCGVEESLRTNSTEYIWKGVQDEEKAKKPTIFRTGELEFVMVEGDLTPSALRYVLKEVQNNSVRFKKVSSVEANEKCRDTGPSYNGVDKSENTGNTKKFKTCEEVPVRQKVQGKPSFVLENKYTSKRTRTSNSGHFEFVLVDGDITPGAFEEKEESFGEYTTSTEVDPLADGK